MGKLWQKLECGPNGDWPIYLSADDICYFAREFISHGGYTAGVGNDVISNFKKQVSYKGTPSWKYKLAAIEQFAKELDMLIPDNVYITSMPSSKTPDHPEYDPRLEQTLDKLKLIKPTINIVKPFANINSREALHQGGVTRTPELIYGNLKWLGLPTHIDNLIIIDDVLTTGSNFKACQRLLVENSPGTCLIGIFWAKTVWLL